MPPPAPSPTTEHTTHPIRNGDADIHNNNNNNGRATKNADTMTTTTTTVSDVEYSSSHYSNCCHHIDDKNPNEQNHTTSSPTTTKTMTTTTTTSTQEEIQQQHTAAQQIVENGIQFSEPPSDQEIPLLQKQRPVNSSFGKESIQVPDSGDGTSDSCCYCCWSSRGYANVSTLQNLIRNGYNRPYDLQNIPPPKKDGTGGSRTGSVNHPECQEQHNSNDSIGSKDDTTESAILNYWDPIVASTHNVYVRRPSHDAWGIPKIVFIYCDDFLQDVYDFPWIQPPSEFIPAIRPILDVLQISLSRVVRLLLASLPPNSTIPVHYDTGEWVKYTHRVHVPILVQDVTKILFRCGPSIDQMASISCQPGHVFEINNQTFHTVSNCDTDYRVHLILDYIDADYTGGGGGNHLHRRRQALQRGETVLQTRRSIDRWIHYGRRPTPTFIILGAQKAGTTYLFELMMQHPLCIKPKNNRRETHCLDWNWNTTTTLRTRDQQQKWCHSFFHYQELQYHPSCCTGDSTPSYIIDHRRVITRLQQVYPPNVKLFILGRNPVLRAQSQYAMVTSKRGTPAQLKARGCEWTNQSLEEVMMNDLLKMKQCGLLPYWRMDSWDNFRDTQETNINSNTNRCHGDASNTMNSIQWETAIFDPHIFNTFSGSTEEDVAWDRYVQQHVPLHTGSYGLLSRGLYHLQIRVWLREFPVQNFLILKLEAMTSHPDVASMTIQEVWNHIDVPYYELPVEALMQAHNAREYVSSMTPSMRDFLYRFYEPHNERLHEVVQALPQSHLKKDLWDHHWGPSSTSFWKDN